MNSQGIVLVATDASSVKDFYGCAIACASSILEHMPDANITLFTTPELFKEHHASFFDQVILETPNEYRAKLWGMANSPYELTLYMDVDMLVLHEDFNKVFDQIGLNDMLWTRITEKRDYAYNNKNGSNRVFPGGEFKIHGGICLYTSAAKKFMIDWYNLDKKIRTEGWWPDTKLYPNRFKVWDQFSLWWLTEKEWDNYKFLKYDFFEDDFRWNYIETFNPVKEGSNIPGKEPIILHYTLRRGTSGV